MAVSTCTEKIRRDEMHMMINKRLIGTVPDSKKYIAGNVVCQWVSLAANITLMVSITHKKGPSASLRITVREAFKRWCNVHPVL